MAAKLVRKTYSLPALIDEDLSYLSGRIGVSRSALLAQIVTEPLHDLRVLVERVPDNPTPEEILRYRGESRALVDARIDGLRRMESDLFAD